MATVKELDVIRTLVPLEGADVFDDNNIIQLPVGSLGTVMHIYFSGEAFDVEFIVGQEDDFVSVQIPVKASQCELKKNS